MYVKQEFIFNAHVKCLTKRLFSYNIILALSTKSIFVFTDERNLLQE